MVKKHSFGVKDAVGTVSEGGSAAPPPGAYIGTLTNMTLKNNSSGDPMFTLYITFNDFPPKLKGHNGYERRHWLNLTDVGAGYVNAFINALAGGESAGTKVQKALWDNGELATKDDSDESPVVSIGAFKPIGKKVGVTLLEDTYIDRNGNERSGVTIGRFMAAGEVSGSIDVDDDDDLVDDGLVDDDDLADDDLADDDENNEEAELRADLEALELKPLRLRARDEYDISAADTKGKTEDEIIDLILDAHFSKEDDPLDDDLDDEPVKSATPITKARSGAKRRTSGDEPPF